MIAFGSWLAQIVVATTGGFALSVLRPRYGRVHHGARCCTTLFVPVRRAARPAVPRDRPPAADPPLVHRQLLGDLAAGRRERLQRHPREALLRQPAARDLRGGANRRRRPVPAVLLDRAADVASRSSASSRYSPCSRRGRTSSGRCSSSPIPNKQPLSVRLPTIQAQTELGVFLAAMFIACLVPIVGFLDLPALVPARHRPRRRDQGLIREEPWQRSTSRSVEVYRGRDPSPSTRST